MTLSPKQFEVIKLMREGWELGQSWGWKKYSWLRLDGRSEKIIRRDTLNSLKNSGMILQDMTKFVHRSFVYTLTILGNTCEIKEKK